MDRNSIVGLVLIVMILLGYNYFTAPSAEEVAEQQRIQDSIAQQEQVIADSIINTKAAQSNEGEQLSIDSDTIAVDSVQLAAKTMLLEEKYGDFASASQAKGQLIKVATPKFTLSFNSKGAYIANVVLNDYLNYGGAKVQLFDPSLNRFNIQFQDANGRTLNTENLSFSSEQNGTIKLAAGDSLKLNFKAGNEAGQQLEIHYTIYGDKYDVKQEIVPVNIPSFYSGQNRAGIQWESAGLPHEKHLDTEKQRCSVFYCLVEDDRDYLSENGNDEEQITEPISWVAFKQNFFSSVIIAPQGLAPTNATFKVVDPQDTNHTKYYAASAGLNPNNSGKAELQLYFGPNDYHILRSYEVRELDRIIDFGWGIFGWVNKYFIIHVFRLLESVNMSYGLIILVLTILIKLILSPLTYKNFVSSAKMRVLKPQIEEINKRLKNADPMKKQQETMALYRKTGVNPLAGCIPMLFQMPILYAMFRFFPASIELRQESFLWADDLSSYDSILDLGFEIPFYGDHVSLFTLLMCISTIGYTAMNSSQMPQQQEGMPNMKVMMYIFPVFMLFFFNNFSSGLSYYYFTANILSITQMWVIKNYIIDEEKILSKIEKNKEKNKTKGKSKFQKRLEEMAKQRGFQPPK